MLTKSQIMNADLLSNLKGRGSFDEDQIESTRRAIREHRNADTTLQNLRAAKNSLSKEAGKFGYASVADRVAEIDDQMAALANVAEPDLTSFPNIPDPSVPFGESEYDNQEVRLWDSGHRPEVTEDHVTVGTALGLNTDLAVSMSGSRFSLMTSYLARLERVLGQWMLDQHVANGWLEVSAPLIVNGSALYNTGQLPKFADDLFKVEDRDSYLIPTSEVTLTNAFAGRLFKNEPNIKVTSLSPCFRSEAGSAGRDTRGLIRQHQFNKVELVSITAPDKSDQRHEEMVEAAEGILKALGLPFRTVLLCSGDMGFSAQKTYDLEVFLPSANKYREISSVSNCGQYQAVRMNTRYKTNGMKSSEYVHTLNGSGVAVGRALVAILENYQTKDGLVIPEALRAHMGDMEFLPFS